VDQSDRDFRAGSASIFSSVWPRSEVCGNHLIPDTPAAARGHRPEWHNLMFGFESCVNLFPFCPPICQIRTFRAFWPIRSGRLGRLRGRSPLPAAAQQLPPHVVQPVSDLIEQLVRRVEPARGIRAASQLVVSLLPLVDAGEAAAAVGGRSVRPSPLAAASKCR
jgi:hypothetical protein